MSTATYLAHSKSMLSSRYTLSKTIATQATTTNMLCSALHTYGKMPKVTAIFFSHWTTTDNIFVFSACHIIVIVLLRNQHVILPEKNHQCHSHRYYFPPDTTEKNLSSSRCGNQEWCYRRKYKEASWVQPLGNLAWTNQII